MKKPVNGLFRVNYFTRAFQEFDEEAFFHSLHNKVKNKSYFQQYKGFKKTILWLSYLFNIASAITASYAVYWFIHKLTGVAAIGYIVALVFLFFLEKIKRKSSTEFWQILFFRQKVASGWLCLSLFCLTFSILSSAFGVKEGTETLAPSAELIHADSMLLFYQSEIALLESKGTDLRNNRDAQGITFYKLSDGISANELVITDYRTRAKELEQHLEGKNEQLSTAYMEEVQLTAWTLVWLTLLMELLFEACIAYIWYYAFRSYVERVQIQRATSDDDSTKNNYSSPSKNHAAIQEQIDALEHQIHTLRASKSQNGIKTNPHTKNHVTEPLNQIRQPIGFFSEQQRASIGSSKNTSAQACTDVYRVAFKDYRTIEHKYIKRGVEHVAYYTLPQIKARIAQYERELKFAHEKGLATDVIKNRKKKLLYWKEKRAELKAKLDQLNFNYAI